MKTINIPARAYDAALRWCNARRKVVGLPADFKKMPHGKPGESRDCPCALAVPGLDVGGSSWHRTDPRTGETVERGDDGPLDFVLAFDRADVQDGARVLPVRGVKRKKGKR